MAIADRIEEMYTHVGDVYDTIRNVDLPEDKNIENIPRTIKDSYLEIMNNGTQQVWDNWDKVNGTGTTLTINNTEEAPMSLVYKGNTLQNGTPTPDSPVPIQVVSGDNSIEVCGKNLAPTDWASDFVSRVNDNSKASLVIEDNRNCVFFLRNTGYGEYDTKYFFKTNWKENTQYTISFYIKPTATQSNLSFLYTDGTNKTLSDSLIANVWQKLTITSLANKTLERIQGYWASGEDYVDIDTFMVYEGTETLPYEPYTGESYPISLGDIELCKIGTYQDKIDKSSGKNLFDKDNANVFNGYWSNNTLITQANSYGIYIPCESNTTYTISKHAGQVFRVATTTNIPANNVSTLSSSANHTGTYITITTEATAKYIWVNYYGSSDTYGLQNMLDSIMIEQNSSATSYEPYGTGWYLKKEIGKVVLDGSENWNIQTTWSAVGDKTNAFYITRPTEINPGQPCYCDYLKYTTTNDIVSTDEYGIGYSSSLILRTPKSITDGNALKTYLASNNMKLYYVLNIPTYTLIEDSTLIEELESMKKSYENQTNITQVNNDMPFELDVVALEGDE